jgi:hypothetical protein
MKRLMLYLGLALLAMIALGPIVLAAPPKFKPTTVHVPPHKPTFTPHSGVTTTTFSKTITTTTTFVPPTKFITKPPVTFQHIPTFSPTIVTPKKTFITGVPLVKTFPTTVLPPSKTFTTKVAVASYATTFGVKFTNGIFYKGLLHRHWVQKYYAPGWKTWCWLCPSTKVWYYWYAPGAVYYPVSYIASAPPVVSSTTIAMPPGADSIPAVAAEEAPVLPEVPE